MLVKAVIDKIVSENTKGEELLKIKLFFIPVNFTYTYVNVVNNLFYRASSSK